MTQNMLGASLKTCHWGYFDATLPPAMTISSGDEVVINTVSGGPQNPVSYTHLTLPTILLV